MRACRNVDVYNCPVVVQPGGNVSKNGFMSGSCVGKTCTWSFASKPSTTTNLTLNNDGKTFLQDNGVVWYRVF